MAVRVAMVDAFVGRRAKGNPAGVCWLEEPLSDSQRQAIARKVGTTAFLENGANRVRIRWFTPAREIDLCGHGTLAAAAWLGETGRIEGPAPIVLDSASGPLQVHRDGPWIELDFPKVEAKRSTADPVLTRALGMRPEKVFENPTKQFAILSSEESVKALRVDAFRAASSQRGVAVAARATTAPFDYVVRYFAAYAGEPEDQATGSIQCFLGPYWAQELGRSELSVHQTSERGGVLRVRPAGDRVKIAGRAHVGPTVVVGEGAKS